MAKEEQIKQSQIIEQNIQNLLLQKQAFGIELAEVKASLKELENSGEEVFKIIGHLMLRTDKAKIKKELSDKKKILDSRLQALEKQEKLLFEGLDNLKKENPPKK